MAGEQKKTLAGAKPYVGKHLAPEQPKAGAAETGKNRTDRKTQSPDSASVRRRANRAETGGERRTAQRPGAAKRKETARRPDSAAGRRPARPVRTSREALSARTVSSRELYQHVMPYIEASHSRNLRSLKAGVWLLLLLPAALVIIRYLTDASKIAFLMIWIFGMFAIATALIFTAYADHDLKKTLEEWEAILPPEEEITVGNLLPVDAEGEGWLIPPEELPIPLPNLAGGKHLRREK